jgi:hypothetical protein
MSSWHRSGHLLSRPGRYRQSRTLRGGQGRTKPWNAQIPKIAVGRGRLTIFNSGVTEPGHPAGGALCQRHEVSLLDGGGLTAAERVRRERVWPPRARAGRSASCPPAQLAELEAGPAACGYADQCWTLARIVELVPPLCNLKNRRSLVMRRSGNGGARSGHFTDRA